MASDKSQNDHHHHDHDHHHRHVKQHNQIFSHQQNIEMMHSSSSSSPFPPPTFNISKDGGAYDSGELDQALLLYLDGQEDQSENCGGMRPPTLNIFPSQPMHEEPSPTTSEIPPNPVNREGNRKGTTNSVEDRTKTDPKTLRRLAQNREAARKSRLRKKAYVQQLETSRMRLAQLEQDLQRPRSQGLYLGGNNLLVGVGVGVGVGDQGISGSIGININPDAAFFDMEYTRWLEEHLRMMVELRKALQEPLPENELRIFVDNCLAHYDQVMNLKSTMARSDVFHLFSGTWRTPAERCFMWIGDFRPSEIIKIVLSQIEALTDEQLMGVCGLQQSTHEAEEALSRGLHALNHSLSETITSESLCISPNMPQMSLAINQLSTLQGFVRQADNLRQQTLHHLHQILTTPQVARCLLTISEYFHRLRALSSLWMSRPRQE